MSAANSHVKVVLVGNGGVGKTTWLRRLITGVFDDTYTPTRGFNEYPITVDQTKFTVFDCAGQYNFRGLNNTHMNDADCVIIMYKVQDMRSQHAVAEWYNIAVNAGSPSKIIVVVNTENADEHQNIRNGQMLLQFMELYPHVSFVHVNIKQDTVEDLMNNIFSRLLT